MKMQQIATWKMAAVLVAALGSGCQAASGQAGRGLASASFAGGCFWSMQKAFDHVPGVVSTTAGYEGGTTKNPTYQEVETGRTGHAETVLVMYDPKKTSYAQLLDAYWHNIDPTAVNQQFCDHGTQYRSIIFYGSAAEQRIALQSKAALEHAHRFARPIRTAIEPATAFYRAEDYHQAYYRKNPVQYQVYRVGCGRDAQLKQLWGSSG